MTEEQNITHDPSTVETKLRKKTMSEAALAANRANAKKCTGPKTRAGKFKSSLNALKHGTYSHNFILKTEDAGTFENFSKSFIDEAVAATPVPVSAASITQQAYDRLEISQPSFARQEAHALRLANLFQRTLCRFNAIRDKELRNETKFIRDRFSFAA